MTPRVALTTPPRQPALIIAPSPSPAPLVLRTDIAAFGGCIELADKLVGLGASVGLPNKDGFTPLDSMQPSGVEGKTLSALLLNRISKPSSWTPDRIVSACQQCKARRRLDSKTHPRCARSSKREVTDVRRQLFAVRVALRLPSCLTIPQLLQLPFNRANPDMARKHHCRHCGRCICMKCSPRRLAIPKFGSAQEERVCLLCERVLKAAEQEKVP